MSAKRWLESTTVMAHIKCTGEQVAWKWHSIRFSDCRFGIVCFQYSVFSVAFVLPPPLKGVGATALSADWFLSSFSSSGVGRCRPSVQITAREVSFTSLDERDCHLLRPLLCRVGLSFLFLSLSLFLHFILSGQ